MQIFIKTPSGRLITLEVDLSDTVEDIKIKIQEKEGLPPNQQQLFLSGHASKPLENNRTIGDYDIQGGITLNLQEATTNANRGDSCCNII